MNMSDNIPPPINNYQADHNNWYNGNANNNNEGRWNGRDQGNFVSSFESMNMNDRV